MERRKCFLKNFDPVHLGVAKLKLFQLSWYICDMGHAAWAFIGRCFGYYFLLYSLPRMGSVLFHPSHWVTSLTYLILILRIYILIDK